MTSLNYPRIQKFKSVVSIRIMIESGQKVWDNISGHYGNMNLDFEESY